jgi:hypothetical protein
MPASVCAVLLEMRCLEPPQSTPCNASSSQQPSRTRRATAGDSGSANVPSEGLVQSSQDRGNTFQQPCGQRLAEPGFAHNVRYCWYPDLNQAHVLTCS